MAASGTNGGGGLSTLDLAKLVLGVIVAIVAIRIVLGILGAAIALISTLLVGAAIVVAAWLVWSLFLRRDGG